MSGPAPDVGVVVIGRNEGQRLRRCLESVLGRSGPVVYVDSGSTDGSADLARSLGAEVVELDASGPFTAARGRNAGFARLSASRLPRYVQFVDGDCGVHPEWVARGAAELEANPRWAVVCGRLRERDRDATPYNRLADMEWDGPTGEVKVCGGILMARSEAFAAAGGFDPSVAAGEEPELCVRLRADGWSIWRIDAEMADHDIAMTRFGQWWRRARRSGRAYAEGAARHGATPERHWVRETRSNWFWGLLVPAGSLALAWPTRGLSLLGAPAGYALLSWRAVRAGRARGWSPRDARLYGAACAAAKLPLAIGQAEYAWRRLTSSARLGGRGRAPADQAGVAEAAGQGSVGVDPGDVVGGGGPAVVAEP